MAWFIFSGLTSCPLRELFDVGEQQRLVFGADGAILGDALLTATQDVSLVIGVSADLDLDRGLLLCRIEW